MTDFSTLSYTVFIAVSAQPRISAHLEKAPILKAEIVIKRPPPPPPPPNQNKRPPPPHPLKWQWHWKLKLNNSVIRDFPEDGVFFRVFQQKPCFVTSSRFFYKHLLFCWKINILQLLKIVKIYAPRAVRPNKINLKLEKDIPFGESPGDIPLWNHHVL